MFGIKLTKGMLTSEFWLSLLTILGVGAVAVKDSGLLIDTPAAGVIAFIVGLYNLSRGIAKNGKDKSAETLQNNQAVG